MLTTVSLPCRACSTWGAVGQLNGCPLGGSSQRHERSTRTNAGNGGKLRGGNMCWQDFDPVFEIGLDANLRVTTELIRFIASR